MSEAYVVSVRQMVEFVLRSGDIDGGFSSVRRAQEGTRLHQKLQKQAMKEMDYRKEVPLAVEAEQGGIILRVEGRADGIFEKDGLPVIDEIKSVTEDLDGITEETHPLHWAQACCYGYIYGMDRDCTSVTVRLTYIHAETESVRYLWHTFPMTELEEIFRNLTRLYFVWLERQEAWIGVRDASIRTAVFPYAAYRKGQRTMAAYVYKAIREGTKAFLQAPTGIGKTLSALFPAVKAMEAGLTDKVFYLTARHTTGLAALEAARQLQEKGARLKCIELSSKDSMCPLERRSCHPADCPKARGHFDRVGDAALAILNREDLLTSDRIRELAEIYNVCPFELSLDLATWADLVVCDYNYVFDPSASLKRFFSERQTGFTILVDEAHNLVDRAREMFSAGLSKESFLEIAADMKKHPQKGTVQAVKAANKVNKVFLALRRELPEEGTHHAIAGVPQELLTALRRFNESMEAVLAEWHGNAPDPWLDLYFHSLFFIRIAEQMDENYVAYAVRQPRHMMVRLYCYHPAHVLSETYAILKSCIFFSATLMPIQYYKEFLGAEETDLTASLPSPFDPARRLILVDDTVPMTYRYREQSVPMVCLRIHQAVMAREGSYFIFFPSFAYMQQVAAQYQETYPDDPVQMQEPGMDDAARQAFLSRMQADGRRLLTFAVMGGVFSESVDLKGDRVIGAIVVTVGLPQIGFERDLIRDRMQERGGEGFAYAYSYPGVGKVLQAAGRVIRTEEDKGFILLIDERYRTAQYQKLLPADWFPIRRTDGSDLTEVLTQFWKGTL